jgi:hypothetical protein
MPHVLQHRSRSTASVSAYPGLLLAQMRAMSSAVEPSTKLPPAAWVVVLVPSAPRRRDIENKHSTEIGISSG